MPLKSKGSKAAILSAICTALTMSLAVWLGWGHVKFWLRFEALGRNAQGFSEFRHRRTGIVFVRLPGGTFWMGAQKDDPEGQNYDPNAFDDEGPVHRVTLSPFLLSKFEVRQEEWEAVMGSNPSYFKGKNLPTEQVSWNDCQEFCLKMKFQLPSEAQWEYACRAGNPEPHAGKLDEMGWYSGNSGDQTHPTGKRKPNPFGLFDMYGNVWEWCEDVYDESFYSKPEASGSNPVGTTGSAYRVFRGGSWGHSPGYCRSAHRFGLSPSYRVNRIGFRLCYMWPL